MATNNDAAGTSTGPTADEPKWSQGDIRQRNQYLREFLPGMVAYGVILVVVLSTVDEESSWAPFALLLPVLPMVWVCIAVYRSLQRADEYTRTIQLESMALGFGAGVIASLAFGFVGMVDVGLGWGPWAIFSVAMATWGLAVTYRTWRG